KESSPRIVQPTKEVVMDQLKRPWSMAFMSNYEALVVEKDGDLLKVNLNTKSKQVIGGFPNDLADSLLIVESKYPRGTYPNGSDGFKGRYNAGIFEVVLDPDFSNNKWIYISYVSEREQQFATKVIRAKLQNNQLVDVETLLLALPYADGLFHFGGGMVFGADEKLYITVGERLFGDMLQRNPPIAQNYEDQRGKIYRINSDGSIPSDNPDFGDHAVAGLYAAGIRAAQGLAVDPRTKDIWFSEHGTHQGDELNILASGANYGWPIISTGRYRGGYEPPKMNRDFNAPMWSWYKTIAPTGLTFYTGTEFPEWKNNLIVPGLSRGNFWRFVIEDNQVRSVEELFINDRHRTRKAVQSPDGHLYILTDENNGKIIRVKNGS
ncbi:MAG: glucose/arabinose dehydrogenase, partial [Saprospiraceae bacterium]